MARQGQGSQGSDEDRQGSTQGGQSGGTNESGGSMTDRTEPAQ